MANQAPTARPWFRLPNFGRLAPPPPQPAPQPPRLPLARPGFAQTFRANLAQPQPSPPQQPPPSTFRSQPQTAVSSPATPPTPPPPQPNVALPPTRAMTSPRTFGNSSPPTPKSSESTPKQSLIKSPLLPSASPRNSVVSGNSLSNSSPTKPVSSPATATKTVYLTTPTASPKEVVGSAQSTPSSQPPIRTTRSPSPVSLPPSQLQASKTEVESRTLTEAEVDKPMIYTASNGNSMKGFANNSKKYGSFKEEDGDILLSDSKDVRNARVITMKGENKGAVMDFGMNGHGGDPHGNFSWSNHNGSNNAVDSDGFHSGNEDNSKGISTPSHLPRYAYVNSNVQGVNDSILYNCSINHHDPGVHFFSRKPINGNNKGNGHGIKHYANGKQL